MLYGLISKSLSKLQRIKNTVKYIQLYSLFSINFSRRHNDKSRRLSLDGCNIVSVQKRCIIDSERFAILKPKYK